jgi:hypothetical protein
MDGGGDGIEEGTQVWGLVGNLLEGGRVWLHRLHREQCGIMCRVGNGHDGKGGIVV